VAIRAEYAQAGSTTGEPGHAKKKPMQCMGFPACRRVARIRTVVHTFKNTKIRKNRFQPIQYSKN
jgi:hypothetical protein